MKAQPKQKKLSASVVLQEIQKRKAAGKLKHVEKAAIAITSTDHSCCGDCLNKVCARCGSSRGIA